MLGTILLVGAVYACAIWIAVQAGKIKDRYSSGG
jgi:hypothetical protein